MTKEREGILNMLSAALKKANVKIAVAESVTGGEIASSLVSIAGISNYFVEGIVSYSVDAKVKRLGVDRKTVDAVGAVSSEVAEQMAEGLMFNPVVDVAVSTTGIAGPDGGSEEKPVGLVYFGLAARCAGRAFSECMVFTGDRATVRENATNYALSKIVDLIVKYYIK